VGSRGVGREGKRKSHRPKRPDKAHAHEDVSQEQLDDTEALLKEADDYLETELRDALAEPGNDQKVARLRKYILERAAYQRERLRSEDPDRSQAGAAPRAEVERLKGLGLLGS
jgi:hypothetical protein